MQENDSPGSTRQANKNTRTTSSHTLLPVVTRMLLTVSMLGMSLASADNLGSKTPYPEPAGRVLSAAPAGYDFTMLQLVARHGSRGLSSPDDDDLSLQLWRAAEAQGALTALGQQLGPAILRVMDIQNDIGYGELSALGRKEHRGLAHRAVARNADFFRTAANANLRVSVSHSGRSRAADSGQAFVAGWQAELPEYAALTDKAAANQRTLYFHKAEGSADYRDYREDDSRLETIMHALDIHPQTYRVSSALLQRLYAPDFVAALEKGELSFYAEADADDQINSAVDAARSLYGLFAISSNLVIEGAPSFSDFITPEHAAWLSYIDDADSFYGRGPGFAGEDITFAAAHVLVADMLDTIQRAADGDYRYAADLRFTHAQVLMPLAAFLGIPNADQGAKADDIFDYNNNPWRAEWVSPMSANIQMEAYRHAKTQQLVVRVLHNEAETPLKKQCLALDDFPTFYPLQELQRCLLAR